VYGDPDALDRLAARLSSRANEIRQHVDDHVRAGQAAHWVSTAATTYRDRVAQDRAKVTRAADALDDAATALHSHAQHVRDTLAEIAQIEHAATAWFERELHDLSDGASNLFDKAKQGLSHLWHEAPWSHWPVTPLSLPASGDRAWLDVGQFLRGQGVL
jgi:uncharacterized protein YukE